METKLPYYMVYPTPLLFDDERRERMDFEYMKSLYPDTARRLLPYVEDECDRMEYEGSMMYDEYPDRLQLTLMTGRVLAQVQSRGSFAEEAGQPESEERFRELVQVLLYQELYKRRCDYRKYKSKYYAGTGPWRQESPSVF